MIPLNTARLPAARKLVADFRAAGVPAPQEGAASLARRPKHSRATTPEPRTPFKEELQRSPAGWPVKRDDLASQLEGRLKGNDLPQQSNTSYCGCAAFLVALLVDRPDIYVNYAISLWIGDNFRFQQGSKSELKIQATRGTMNTLSAIQASVRVRSSAVSDLDWMTMASLSAAGLHGSAVDVAFPKGINSEFHAITWPPMMRRWFSAVGAAPQLDSVGVGALSASVQDFLDLLCLWETHWLILEIDASLIQGGFAFVTNRHWVVVNPVYPPKVHAVGSSGPGERPTVLKDAYRSSNSTVSPALGHDIQVEASLQKFGGKTIAAGLLKEATVDMQVVSWAQDWHTFQNPTLSHIASRFYGGYACPRFR